MTATDGTGLEELDSPDEVLRVARAARAASIQADKVLLVAAVAWAEQHPPESIGEQATWITAAGDTGVPIAGQGAPLVSEFCIAEFALAIGRSTDAGRSMIAASVELKYRLTRTWGRVQSGDLEAWRPPDRRSDHRAEPGGRGVCGRPGGGLRAPDRDGCAGAAGRGGDRPVHARTGAG
jgi:hypothetical protein